jgi:hypothetical protein
MAPEHDMRTIWAQNPGGTYVYGDVKKSLCRTEVLFIQARIRGYTAARRAYRMIRRGAGVEFEPIQVDRFTGYLSL